MIAHYQNDLYKIRDSLLDISKKLDVIVTLLSTKRQFPEYDTFPGGDRPPPDYCPIIT